MRKWFPLLLFLPFMVNGQDRKEFWFKLNVSHPINTKWSVGVDLHHRRQANFQLNDKNIFHLPLGTYARAWVNYSLPGNWTIILSPIGYFHNEDILNRQGELKQTNELRISPGIIKEWSLGSIKNKNRLLYDARFAEYNQPDHFFQSRFRLQNSFIIPLIKKEKALSYLLHNEIILKKEKGQFGFDQNRVYNALQFKIHKTEADLGYQCILQKGTSSTFQRKQLFVMLNIII